MWYGIDYGVGDDDWSSKCCGVSDNIDTLGWDGRWFVCILLWQADTLEKAVLSHQIENEMTRSCHGASLPHRPSLPP